MIFRFLAATVAAACALPAAALLIRPDRDDAEYLELATRYTSAVALNAPGGEGVLIAPRWVLTAAHRAKELQSRARARVRLAGREIEVQSIHIHPRWARGAADDIALVFLREGATGLEPTPIHRGGEVEGDAVVLVGHGPTGRIADKAPPGRADGRARAAINTIERVEASLLALKIKAADDASDLQGALVAAETGAPAYVETPKGIFVAGIAARIDDANRDGIAGNAGDREWFTRVSAFADWIDKVMFDVAAREASR